MQSLKLCENYTINTKYDISGLSDLLKMNKQLNSVCKQMMLKYNCFTNTPPLITSNCQNKWQSKLELKSVIKKKRT